MITLLIFLLGLSGFFIDQILKTPFLFQSVGTLAGYVIWVKNLYSRIRSGDIGFKWRYWGLVLIVTWSAVFFSGAPFLGLSEVKTASDLRSGLGCGAAVISSILVLCLLNRAAKSPRISPNESETEDRIAREKLDEAVKLEAKGELGEAFKRYNEIVQGWPGTSAAEEAKACARSVEKKIQQYQG